VRTIGVLVAVALALVLQTTVAGFVTGSDTAVVDLVLVAVVYVALTMGPVAGLLTGSVAGVLQDALSSGVIGIGGLSKSLVGFVIGVIGQQFIVTSALPRLVAFVGATAGHAAVFMGVYALLGLRTFPSPWQGVTGQVIGNAVVGMVAFAIADSLPGVVERRRLRRGR